MKALDEIKKAMEAGPTPGEWRAEAMGGASTVLAAVQPRRNDTRIPSYGYRGKEHCIAYPFVDDDGSARLDFVCLSHSDAAHIAACSPSNISALLAHIQALESERDAALEQVRALEADAGRSLEERVAMAVDQSRMEQEVAGLRADAQATRKNALVEAANECREMKKYFETAPNPDARAAHGAGCCAMAISETIFNEETAALNGGATPDAGSKPVRRCEAKKCGEFNMLRCAYEAGHTGDHCYVVDDGKATGGATPGQGG